MYEYVTEIYLKNLDYLTSKITFRNLTKESVNIDIADAYYSKMLFN